MGTYHLDLDERNSILEKLTVEQRDFLENVLKRGRKTAFANALLNKKAKSYNLFEEAEDNEEPLKWELIDYIDGGEVSKHLLCECGKQLRYQYIVKNVESGQILKFGVTHFEEHTGIPPKIAKAVVAGIQEIDYEMDELLTKIDVNYQSKIIKKMNLPEELIPKEILEQMKLGIPLLDRQENRLIAISKDYSRRKYKEEWAREHYSNFASPSPSQMSFDDELPNEEHKEKSSSNFTIPNQVSFEEEFLEDKKDVDYIDVSRAMRQIEQTSVYKEKLLNDCINMIRNDLNSVNLMVEELLEQPVYQQLFENLSSRTCYRILVSRLVEAKVNGECELEGAGLSDRSDSYFYFNEPAGLF